MEIYEIVKNNARLGYYSIIKDHRGKFYIVSPRRSNFSYPESHYSDSVSEAIATIGKRVGTSDYRWRTGRKNHTYVGTYLPDPFDRFNPGEKVRVKVGEYAGGVYEVATAYENEVTILVESAEVAIELSKREVEPYYDLTPRVVTLNGKKYRLTDELKEALSGAREDA